MPISPSSDSMQRPGRAMAALVLLAATARTRVIPSRFGSFSDRLALALNFVVRWS
jgi:hypothetical protein